jgi:hypothetical protein
VVVHVPHLLGYFSNRLAVVKLCLESLLRHKPAETEVLVFDNGSCPEVGRFLEGLVGGGGLDFLWRSRTNIGTPAAMRLIFGLAHRPLVAYSDDDVFFFPGWLEPQLAVLGEFPGAGMVTGVPTLDGADHALESTLAWTRAERTLRVEPEAHIPEAWEEEWARSTGRDPAERLRQCRATPAARVGRQGIEAFVGASHFQFVGPVARLLPCLPAEWPNSLMGNMRDLDESIDRAGFLRLSTTGRHVLHMGNAVGEALRRQAADLGFEVAPAARVPWISPLEIRLERNRRVHSKVWVAYRSLGRFLDGENILPESRPRRGVV